MNSQFAGRISELRKEKGLSQRKAAADFGISQALLSHYENSLREPGLDFVLKACDYYGVTADYLLGRDDERERISKLEGELKDLLEGTSQRELSAVCAVLVLLRAAEETDNKELTETAGLYIGECAHALSVCGDFSAEAKKDMLRCEADLKLLENRLCSLTQEEELRLRSLAALVKKDYPETFRQYEGLEKLIKARLSRLE